MTNKGLTLIGRIGLGVALMYMLVPKIKRLVSAWAGRRAEEIQKTLSEAESVTRDAYQAALARGA